MALFIGPRVWWTSVTARIIGQSVNPPPYNVRSASSPGRPRQSQIITQPEESGPAPLTIQADDDVGLTDSLVLELQKPVTDAVGLSDTLPLSLSKPFDDSAGLTDSFSTSFLLTATFDDNAGLSDNFTLSLVRTIDQTDTVGLVDTLGLSLTKVVTDTTGVTDTLVRTVGKEVTDSVGLTDSLALVSNTVLIATDTAGLTDATALSVGKAITDDAGLTDSFTLANASVAVVQTFTDNAGLTDSLTFDFRYGFQTPTVGQAMPRSTTWSRYSSRVGVSVVKVAGVYQQLPYPSQEELAGLTDGVDYFLGGYEYQITPAIRTELIAAGITV